MSGAPLPPTPAPPAMPQLRREPLPSPQSSAPASRLPVRAAPGEPPATVSPALHAAFLGWLGAKGSLRSGLKHDEWCRKAGGRWKLATWREKLQAKGVEDLPTSHDALMDRALTAFIGQHPDWSTRRRGR